MKKKSAGIVSALLALTFSVSLAACGEGDTVSANSIEAAALDVPTTLTGYALSDTKEEGAKTVYGVELLAYVAEPRPTSSSIQLNASDFEVAGKTPSSIRLPGKYYRLNADGKIYTKDLKYWEADTVDALIENTDLPYKPYTSKTSVAPGQGAAGDAYVDTAETAYTAKTSVYADADANYFFKILLEFDEPFTGGLTCHADGKRVEAYGPSADFFTQYYDSDDYVYGRLQMCVLGEDASSSYEIRYGSVVKTYGEKVNETLNEKAVYFTLHGLKFTGKLLDDVTNSQKLRLDRFTLEADGETYTPTGYGVPKLADPSQGVLISSVFTDAKYADDFHLQMVRKVAEAANTGDIPYTNGNAADVTLYFEALTEIPAQYKLLFDGLEIAVA